MLFASTYTLQVFASENLLDRVFYATKTDVAFLLL